MKRILTAICIASMCVCASGRELSAERTDNPWVNWTTGQNGGGDVKLWDLGGVLPTLEDDIYYKANGTWFFVSNVNDLVNKTFYAKSLTLISTGEAGYFNIDSGIGFIEIAQDVNLTVENSDKSFGFGDLGKTSVYQRITIGGNLTFDGRGEFKTVFVDNYDYSENDVAMIIGGTANFVQEGSRWKIEGNRNNGVMMYTWIQLGGLNGTNLKLSTNETHAADFNLVFKSDGKKAFTGGEWRGAFTSYWSGGKTASIIMDGGANGGKQTVRLLDSMIEAPDAKMETLTLEMRSGTMALGNGINTKFTQVDMNGGTLYIVDPLGANDNGGVIYTDVLNLNGGDLIFDVDNSGNDIIEVAAINGSDTNIIINFDANDFHVGDDIDGLNFDIFRGVSSADWEEIGKHIKFTLGGVEVTVGDYSLVNGNLSLSGSIIPEPATLAAVFGALAFALAVCRRRKI